MLENNLNIRINLNLVSFEELIKKESTGDFEMITKSWGADYNDPMTFLSVFDMTESGNTWYDRNFKEAVENSARTTGVKRDKFLIEAEKILIDGMPAIPVFHNRYCYRFNRRFKM